MKPLRLIMQAFGPFAGREEVDFARLPEGALFLISGPTGAGKTSILDGLSYALYGDTSGGERSAREMRSHHADAAVETEVEFDFALGARRYRVRRVPEQERAARRGGGLAKVLAKAELSRLEEDGHTWTPLAHKTTEVTALVEELLGFKAEQFRQVVVLPQGQFRRLLAASSAEREKILETLFATAAYKRVQDALKAEAATLRERGEKAALQRRTLLDQAGAETAEAVAAQQATLSTTLAGLTEEEGRARSEDAAARLALQQGQAVEASFAEAASAAAALEVLEAGKAELDVQRAVLASARRAQQIVPAEKALASARRGADEARTQVEQVGREAVEAARCLDAARHALQAEVERASVREAAQRELLRLEGLAETVARAAEADAELARSDAVRVSADKALADAAARHETLRLQRSELVARIDTLQAPAAEAGSLALQVQQAEQRVAALAALAHARTQLAGRAAAEACARQAFEAAEEGARAAHSALEALDARWRTAQAVVLARHLHEGEPCPVCGSATHPARARHDGELPTEQALQAAAEQARAAEQALDAARRALNAAELARAGAAAAVDTRAAALASDLGAAQAAQGEQASPDAALAELRRRLDAAQAAAREITPLRAQLNETDAAIAAVTAVCEQARSAAAEAASVARAAQHVAQERRAGVPEALRTPDALHAATAAAKAARERAEQALQQAQHAHHDAASREAALRARHAALNEAAQAARMRVDEATQQFMAALAAAGFGAITPDSSVAASGAADPAQGLAAAESAWRAALLPLERIDRLETSLRSADDRLAAARARAQRASQDIAGRVRPELAVLEARAAAARERIESVLARIGDTRAALRTLDTLLSRLEALARESGAIEAEYRVVGHLAEVANGNNGRNLTFQRYVLAALLDDVLRAASERLAAMSRGRYRLQRREELADARRAGGLDLEVFDEYTGRSRPAGTLSGGEGFMASLSLALGLSDVVQGYAGGVQLDTLFIDEGFGSLDPEALDLAMKVLIDLQQRGRSVGVISHVEEMKQQIDVAIEVVQGVRGSHVRIRS